MSDALHRVTIAPILPVDDVTTATAYYREKLGFTVNPPTDEGQTWAIVQFGQCEVILVPRTCPCGFAIQIECADETFATLRSQGAVLETGPTTESDTRRSFLVNLPGGYQVQYWQRLTGSDEIHGSSRQTSADSEPF